MRLTSKPSLSEALGFLRESTSVQDWNRRRAEIQSAVSHKRFMSYAYHIDACGLSVQVLGKSPRGKFNSAHKARKNG